MKKTLSSYWLKGHDRMRELYLRDPTSPEYLLQLASVRRGVASFVRIVTRMDIPVHFSVGKQSYAANDKQGKKFIVISAIHDPVELDAQVGVALHEAAHIILTERSDYKESTPGFEFLKFLFEMVDMRVIFPPELLEDAKRLGLSDDTVKKWLKDMINFLEDRRIDHWMYNAALGYRGYYDAMYAKYWLHPRIGYLLKSKKTHIPTLRNYRFHVINMINEMADSSALPGLKDIWDLVDVHNIQRFDHDPKWNTFRAQEKPAFKHTTTAKGTPRLLPLGYSVIPQEELPDIVSTAIKIVGVVFANVEADVQDEVITADEGEDEVITAPTRQKTTDENLDMPDEDEGDDLGDEDEGDDLGDEGEDEENDKDVLDEVLDKQDKFLDGDIDKDDITPDQKTVLDALESSGADYKTVNFGGKFPASVVVYNQLTRPLLASPTFPFSESPGFIPKIDEGMVLAIKDGERIGNMLTTRLEVMADEQPLTFTRQKAGKIDGRILADLGVGEFRVFERTVIEKYRPVDLHISIDASNSMHGMKWYNSMRLAVALAKAADKIHTLNVVISIRAGTNTVQVLIAHDSRKDSFIKLKSLFPYLRESGGTPEGLAFAAIKERILSTGESSSRKYFLNISDGEPVFFWTVTDDDNKMQTVRYGDEEAVNHTAHQVADLRNSGIEVMSYFIHNNPILLNKDETEPGLPDWMQEQIISAKTSIRDFKKMYGVGAQVIDPTNVTQIAATLNKMFLTK